MEQVHENEVGVLNLRHQLVVERSTNGAFKLGGAISHYKDMKDVVTKQCRFVFEEINQLSGIIVCGVSVTDVFGDFDGRE